MQITHDTTGENYFMHIMFFISFILFKMVALLDIGAREAQRERVGRVRGDPSHLLHHRGSTADCLCIS